MITPVNIAGRYGDPMGWLEDEHCDTIKHWIKHSTIPKICSAENGEIYWANEAFEELIGYSEYELTTGQNGKGIKWTSLSVDDGNLEADRKMVSELVAGRREKYTVRKQYLPKNDKPIWVELHVLRYPVAGQLQCFLVTVNPLKNGNQVAAQVATDALKNVLVGIEEIKTHQDKLAGSIVETVTENLKPRTEAEQIASAAARLINAHPRASGIFALVVITMILGTQLVQAVDAVKRMAGYQVDTVKVQP